MISLIGHSVDFEVFKKLVGLGAIACYDLGSSLHKRNDLQGKDGLTSVLRYLTNGLAQANAEDYVGRTRASGSKGQPLTVAAEVGMEDTSSDGY